MAISIEARAELITLVVGMFGAAPGASVLSDLVAAKESGASVKQIAANIATTAEFTSIYPTFLTDSEFATQLIENLVGSTVTATDKANAAVEVTAMLTAGASRSSVIVDVIAALQSVPEDNEFFGEAAAQFNNRVDVANYFSVVKQKSGGSLEELQNVIASVTADDTTVTDAKQLIDDSDISGSFTLTAGANTVVGFAGNDVITALSIDADGDAATTFSAFDNIDGGAGKDTLNIYTDDNNALNNSFPGTVVVKNVEIVNIFNADGAADLADASNYQGVEELWQIGEANTVTNLKASTVAGFKTIDGASLEVIAAATAVSASVALADVTDTSDLYVEGAALETVTITGAVIDDAGTSTVASLAVEVLLAEDAEVGTVNSAVKTTLTIENDGGDDLLTVDASGSTGAITYTTADADVQTIKTGTGADTVTIITTTDGTVGAEISALVETGAGKDTVNVATTGDGTTTINTGAADDTVSVTARSDVLVVDLGEGNDTFTSTVAITADDTIDAGAGTDTLLLSLVGAVNVGAFSNFDVYDVKGMNANLDLDILNENNTVTEIVGSAALGGAATLLNVGAGVNFRATGNMALANVLTLTQKTAGALTVTLDKDQATNVAGDDVVQTSVVASNATSASAVFDSSYVGVAGAAGDETAGTDNISTITLGVGAATAVTVVSGGANATNVLNLNDDSTGATGKLASLTITGTQKLTLVHSFDATANALATIDASGSTGGLTASTLALKNGGNITLGSGTDVITVDATSTTAAGAESITGFEKTADVSVSVVAGDAVAKAAAIAAADKLVIAGGIVADNSGDTADGTVTDGVLTFLGAGPATLDAAIALAAAAADDAGEVLVFAYLGNSYVYGEAGDTLVKLVGVTGVTDLVETGTDNFFVV